MADISPSNQTGQSYLSNLNSSSDSDTSSNSFIVIGDDTREEGNGMDIENEMFRRFQMMEAQLQEDRGEFRREKVAFWNERQEFEREKQNFERERHELQIRAEHAESRYRELLITIEEERQNFERERHELQIRAEHAESRYRELLATIEEERQSFERERQNFEREKHELQVEAERAEIRYRESLSSLEEERQNFEREKHDLQQQLNKKQIEINAEKKQRENDKAASAQKEELFKMIIKGQEERESWELIFTFLAAAAGACVLYFGGPVIVGGVLLLPLGGMLVTKAVRLLWKGVTLIASFFVRKVRSLYRRIKNKTGCEKVQAIGVPVKTVHIA